MPGTGHQDARITVLVSCVARRPDDVARCVSDRSVTAEDYWTIRSAQFGLSSAGCGYAAPYDCRTAKGAWLQALRQASPEWWRNAALEGRPMRHIPRERIGTGVDELTWHAEAGNTASTDPVTEPPTSPARSPPPCPARTSPASTRNSLRSATSQTGSASAAKQSASGRQASGAPAHRSPNPPDESAPVAPS